MTSNSTWKMIRSNLIKTTSKKEDDKPMTNTKTTFIKPTIVLDLIDIIENDNSSFKTKKSALLRDENVIVFESSRNTLINHRSIYQVYTINSLIFKLINVPTNNMKMNIFSFYPLYNIYIDMNFETVESKNLLSASTILSDFWFWKLLNDGISDYKDWNANFIKRDLRMNRVSVERLAITFCHTTKTWHYVVVYKNIELHEDDERRLKWFHVLNRKVEKKPLISLERPSIQDYANRVSTIVNLLDTNLTFREKTLSAFMWPGTYIESS